MRILLLIVYIVLLGQCKAQRITEKGSSQQINSIMEKFDKAAFEKNKSDGEYVFSLPGGKQVRQMENLNDREYIQEVEDSVTPFSDVTVFYMDNGSLKIIGKRFYDFPVGIWTYFSVSGELEKEVDWDKEFKFTIEQLADTVKSFKINILERTKGVDVIRSTEEGPAYIVVYPVGPMKPYDYVNLVYDGTDGHFIEKEIRSVKK
jgi:hypothetical protein